MGTGPGGDLSQAGMGPDLESPNLGVGWPPFPKLRLGEDAYTRSLDSSSSDKTPGFPRKKLIGSGYRGAIGKSRDLGGQTGRGYGGGRLVVDALRRCTVRMEGSIAIRKEVLVPNMRCGSLDQGKNLQTGVEGSVG